MSCPVSSLEDPPPSFPAYAPGSANAGVAFFWDRGRRSFFREPGLLCHDSQRVKIGLAGAASLRFGPRHGRRITYGL